MTDQTTLRNEWANTIKAFAAAAALIALAGCTTGKVAPKPGDDAAELNDQVEDALASIELQRHVAPDSKIVFHVVSFDALEGWEEDDHGAALESFQRSCRKLNKLSKTTVLGGLASEIDDWRPSCEAAETVDSSAARAFFELAFAPVKIEGKGAGKITSYYEPELEARRKPEGKFQHPILGKPKEIGYRDGKYGIIEGGSVRPGPSRAEIYAGAYDGRGLEIAYLDDPVSLFFLQIQGSGRLRFEDGSTLRVGFSARNGRPYKSAAQAMINQGLATKSTASANHIKAFVRKDPEKGRKILEANPSYVFFRALKTLDPEYGPVGALGVQLTDGRSIAVDRAYTPLAAPVWLEVESGPAGAFKKLVVAQDTGSAILGAQRADYFWGTGEEAGRLAGQMNSAGSLTVLLPTATVKRLTEAAPSS